MITWLEQEVTITEGPASVGLQHHPRCVVAHAPHRNGLSHRPDRDGPCGGPRDRSRSSQGHRGRVALTTDGTKALLTGQLEATLRDATTWRVLRTWKGLSNGVLMDPRGGFAFVQTRDVSPAGSGRSTPRPALRARRRGSLSALRGVGCARFQGSPGAWLGSGSGRFAYERGRHQRSGLREPAR